MSEAKRVAPGYIIKFRVALKGRNTVDISAFQAFPLALYRNPGATRSLRSRLPLAFTFRAFGALFRLLVQRRSDPGNLQ